MTIKRRYEVTVRTYADIDRMEFEDTERTYETSAVSERQAVANIAWRTGVRFSLARPRCDDGRHVHEVVDVRETGCVRGQMALEVSDAGD